MLSPYKPEGYLIGTPENHEVLSSLPGIEKAIEKQKILESVALVCDSSYNLHFDLYGIPAVMPRSEVQSTRNGEEVKDIAVLTRVGKPVAFTIIGIKRDENGKTVAVLSRRRAQEECRRRYIDGLLPGDILPATVTHLENFGAFVDIGCGIVSLLSIDSISVSRITHPRDRLRVGDRIRVVVKNIDAEGRLYVSQRELYGTWKENAARFHAGDTVAGIVRSIENYGIFVELAPNLAGLAELKDNVEVGDVAAVYIKSIIKEKMKIKLVIIDTEGRPERNASPKYFVDTAKVTHLSSWRYSPENCPKVIETVFD